MTTPPSAADHHAQAAAHHGQAAHFHRQASRHYQNGKDYAHAAHQALTARGHALRALEHGEVARDRYAAQEGSPLPGYLTRAAAEPVAMAVSSPAVLNAPAHHEAAAAHHEAARRHHTQAGTHSGADHYIRANHETKYALDHGAQAIFHGDRAALHHMEHYGSHPSAELV